MADILLVEDNERTRRLMLLLLRPLGHTLLEAHTGNDALAILRTVTPDLILLDMQLPDVSGFDVATAVRHDPRFTATPIIAVTAYAMPGDAERCLAAGCTAYVTKPIDTRAFPTLIATYVDPHRLPRFGNGRP